MLVKATTGAPSLRFLGRTAYTVPAHCNSLAAVVVTALSTKVVWAA